MNIRTISLAILLVGILVGGGCVTQRPTAWEYHVEYNVSLTSFEQTKKKIEALGSEGWELVIITDAGWVFKRQKK